MAVGNPFSRRGFLTVGAVGFGLSLGDFFRLQGAGRPEELRGDRGQGRVGHPHLPARRHGPPGDRSTPSRSPRSSTAASWARSRRSSTARSFSETLTKTAQIADKITVIRSMTHGEAAHERGTHNMFTGYRPSPALQFPSMGSVVSHEFGVRNNLPPYVCVPSMPNDYAGTGYLSSSFSPVQPRQRPGRRRLPRPGPEPARRRRRGAVRDPPERARRGQRPLRQARRSRTTSRRWTRSTSGPTA